MEKSLRFFICTFFIDSRGIVKDGAHSSLRVINIYKNKTIFIYS